MGKTVIRHYPPGTDDRKYPMEIKIHDGWFPLLRVPYLLQGSNNPYFNMGNHRINGRVYNKIKLNNGNYAFKYKAGRRGVVSIYSGYMSAMGITGGSSNLPSSVYGLRLYRMYGQPDIFCLGVVKPSKLPIIKRNIISKYSYRNYSDVTFNSEDVTILVSIEKLRKAKFQKEKYTSTVRNEILFQLDKLQLDYNVKVEDVPEEYLKNFCSMPEGVDSTSIVETMQMETAIKERVFSNLNSIVA